MQSSTQVHREALQRQTQQDWANREYIELVICLNTIYFKKLCKGSSINDVTQFWTIFDTPPSIVNGFITTALVLLSQNPWQRLHLWTAPNQNYEFL